MPRLGSGLLDQAFTALASVCSPPWRACMVGLTTTSGHFSAKSRHRFGLCPAKTRKSQLVTRGITLISTNDILHRALWRGVRDAPLVDGLSVTLEVVLSAIDSQCFVYVASHVQVVARLGRYSLLVTLVQLFAFFCLQRYIFDPIC